MAVSDFRFEIFVVAGGVPPVDIFNHVVLRVVLALYHRNDLRRGLVFIVPGNVSFHRCIYHSGAIVFSDRFSVFPIHNLCVIDFLDVQMPV